MYNIVNRVAIGSLPHILPILFFIGISILLYKYAIQQPQKKQHKIFCILGILVSLTVVCNQLLLVLQGNYSLQSDLPLFLCSFMALTIPAFTCTRNFLVFEILVFFSIAGTTQAVITPDVSSGFPSFEYFRYWIVHLGLLTIIFYAIRVLKMRPTKKSIVKAVLALHIYMAIIMLVNYFLDANYSYLCNKPKSASLLDYFGEWPYYILVVELIIIPYFFLIYYGFQVFHSNTKK